MWKKYSSAIQCQWSNDYECRLADDVKLSATWEATHVDGEAWIPDLHSSFFLLCYFSSCLVCFCDVICVMRHTCLMYCMLWFRFTLRTMQISSVGWGLYDIFSVYV